MLLADVQPLWKGLYCKPINSQLFGRVLPSVDELVEYVTRHRGHRIEVHGAEAAQHFRLSTQQPMRPVYHTTGPTETLQIGGQPVEFVHLPERYLKHAGTPAGKAIVALKYVGPKDLTPEIADKVMKQLKPQHQKRLMACAKDPQTGYVNPSPKPVKTFTVAELHRAFLTMLLE